MICMLGYGEFDHPAKYFALSLAGLLVVATVPFNFSE